MAIVEAGLVAGTDKVRTPLAASIERTRRRFLDTVDLGELDTAAFVLAFAELQAVEQALPEYRTSPLRWLRRRGEAETEARRAYRTGQDQPRYRHTPNRADAIADASKAPGAPRERTAPPAHAGRAAGGGYVGPGAHGRTVAATSPAKVW
ncbi:hypothetical protein GCM10010232_56450 [Streptomyces amakusaensis]|uniref:Uncharacterized protein n=1 Tax=Streptomyces amakusaensis TaxID=67271 RepID=A0ABW0ANB7_9ACTN